MMVMTALQAVKVHVRLRQGHSQMCSIFDARSAEKPTPGLSIWEMPSLDGGLGSKKPRLRLRLRLRLRVFVFGKKKSYVHSFIDVLSAIFVGSV